jgi:hypothetical protein
MLTPDWWGRQYMEEPNQPYAKNLSQTPFWNTNSWGQTFGLEPNYPCCTVNHPQGWPKFLSNSFFKIGESDLAHALLSPAIVRTQLSGGNVTVSATTAYPFLDQISYTIHADAPFSFHVRVPAWAGSKSSISFGSNTSSSSLSPDPNTGLHKITLPKGLSNVLYTLDSSSIRTEARENDTMAVYKGSLLYALAITNTNTSTLPKPWNDPSTYYNASYAPAQSRDWEYHNTSAWNYAVDPTSLVYHGPDGTSTSYELINPIFASGAPPGFITAQACKIDWPLAHGSIPGFPPTGDARKCLGDAEEVRLVPYASAKTHMAELPIISLSE